MKLSEIEFAHVDLDGDSGRVFDKQGNELELRYQSREVLAALIATPNETVTRETLIDTIWSGRSVADDSVAQCIAEIRRVLNDTDKRIIETVPRKGYRFNPPATPDVTATPQRRWRQLAGAAFLVLVACMIALAMLRPKAPAAPAAPPVIAVLPFEDFSVAAHQGFLSDSVAESIITMLARYPQMTVISRRSSFQFRGSGLGIKEIAKQLNADFILEGSQSYDGSQVRITAQLIDAATNAHVWADEISLPLDELLTTNFKISGKIASATGFTMLDAAEARIAAGDVSALMISNAAQRRIMRDFTRENLLINLREQEKAISDYPDSAWGYLGQALALRLGTRHGWIEEDREAVRIRMHSLARQAVALDPNNYMAHHALGRVLMFNRDVEAAIGSFKRGVELNPSSTLAGIGLADALVFVGQTEEALEVIKKIETIDPLYGFSLAWTKSWALWQAEDCEQALEVFLAMPSMPVAAYKELAAIHHCLGNVDKAKQVMIEYIQGNPNWTLSKEREDNTGMWTAPGSLERWMVAMEAAGMPSN